MFKKLSLFIITIVMAILISCDDDPFDPGNGGKNGDEKPKYIFYSKTAGAATFGYNDYRTFQVRRIELTTDEDIIIRDSAVLIGVADGKVYYCNVSKLDYKTIETWRCSPDGSNIEKLGTFAYFSFLTPQLSPDGSIYLFHSYEDKMTFRCSNVDGSNDYAIFECGRFYQHPMPLMGFFPNSYKIYISQPDFYSRSNVKIYSVNRDGSNLVNTNNINGFGIMLGSLSCDNKYAYDSVDKYGNGYITVMNLNTNSKDAITNDGIRSFNLTFSPGGDKIAFYKNAASLFIINSDGKNLNKVTDVQMQTGSIIGLSPVWSANGKLLLFRTSTTNSGDYVYQGSLNMYNFNTNELKTLVPEEKVWNAFFL